MRAKRSEWAANAAPTMAAPDPAMPCTPARSRAAATGASVLLEAGEQPVEVVGRAVDHARGAGEFEEYRALRALDDRPQQLPPRQLALRLHVHARGEERAGDLHARDLHAVNG